MGTWGPAIRSNDAFEDVYGEFFDRYNDGESPGEIVRTLEKSYPEFADETDEDHDNFWFALALALWECKALPPEVLEKVSTIIESGKNLRLWEELGGNEKDLKKREQALQAFLVKLQSEKAKPKTRKQKKILEPLFAKGDCLTFQMRNGNYGGMIVLEAIQGEELGNNLLLETRLNQPDKPTVEDFLRSEVLVYNFGQWDKQVGLVWIDRRSSLPFVEAYERVGQVKVNRQYDPDQRSPGETFTSLNNQIMVFELQFAHEAAGGKAPQTHSVKKYLRRKGWFF